jgi:DNA-binding PadR family transcriptional regulator
MNGKDFKLPSPIEMEILKLLTGREMYGMEIVRASGKLVSGSVYVFLVRMEGRGLISSRRAEVPGHKAPKQLYAITPLGQKAIAAWQQVQDVMSA